MFFSSLAQLAAVDITKWQTDSYIAKPNHKLFSFFFWSNCDMAAMSSHSILLIRLMFQKIETLKTYSSCYVKFAIQHLPIKQQIICTQFVCDEMQKKNRFIWQEIHINTHTFHRFTLPIRSFNIIRKTKFFLLGFLL